MSIEDFNVLLDFVASSATALRIAEVPYVFRTRTVGESKLDSLVLWEYGILLLDKMFGRFVPPRLVLFALAWRDRCSGAFHHAVHAVRLIGTSFVTAQGIATFVAMTTNFVLNDWLTYRDKRLKRSGGSLDSRRSISCAALVRSRTWASRRHRSRRIRQIDPRPNDLPGCGAEYVTPCP